MLPLLVWQLIGTGVFMFSGALFLIPDYSAHVLYLQLAADE